jgi:hypothetical protein
MLNTKVINEELINEADYIAEKLIRANPDLNIYEAFQIASLIQRNRILQQAYLVNGDYPSVLEKIAMSLNTLSEE